MGIEDPAIWLTLSGTLSTAAFTAMGWGFKVWREKIRARSRKENLVEALKDAQPAERSEIIKALTEYERPANDSAPVAEIASSVARKTRRAVESKLQ